jgi:hypothetical protein
MALLAFSPFVLLAWSATGEDKAISLLLLVVVLVCLERDQLGGAWVAAVALFVIKFESIFFLLPLAAYTFKRRGPRYTTFAIAAFAVAGAVAELPYFPDSLHAFSRRSARIDLTPIDASWTIILNRLGLYDHSIVRPLIVLCLLAIALAFIRGWINVSTAIVLSMFASFLFLPDESYDRIALIVMPLILVVTLTRFRLLAIWLVTVVSAIALYAVRFSLTSLPEWFLRLVGPYASVHHVIFMNLLVVVLLGYLAIDLMTERRGDGAARPRAHARGPTVNGRF